MVDEGRDEEIEALARAMHLGEACDLAQRRGDVVRAFELALEARDHRRAADLARTLALEPDPAKRRSLGNRARAAAVRRGDATAEGLVAEACGDLVDAANLFEAGGAWGRAAAIHRALGEVGRAGRALERQVRADPDDGQARVELAEVLVEAGRNEAALRVLSNLDDARARAIRARVHSAMGLDEGGSTTPATRTSAPEGLLFGRYEVVREIASTASSRVLEARDRLAPDAARVALKIFTGGAQIGAGRDALVRFQREMDILTHIEASSVLRARAVLAEGPTIVLPWMSGGSVAELIARGSVMPRRAAELIVRVLDALEAAHRRGIIHRDVKPANILLDEAGGAYLADFGVAHLGDASATATAGLLGTLRYMSPEQKRGEPSTGKSDLYAVGVVLAELIGAPSDPASLPDTLPIEVAALLRDLLADDPSARPDATTARARVTAIAWPDQSFADFAARKPSERPPSSMPPAGDRFVEADEGVQRDTILERVEVLISTHDARDPLAQALAELAHPALPSVFGVDPRTAALRVERVQGASVSKLEEAEARAIDDALGKLHGRSLAHGDVARSLRRTSRGVVLDLPERAAFERATIDGDLKELARLRR